MSNGFQKFISGKGFYLALAVCLAGAGAAAWVAVDKTIQSVEPAPMAEKPQLKQEQPYEPAKKQPAADTPSAQSDGDSSPSTQSQQLQITAEAPEEDPSAQASSQPSSQESSSEAQQPSSQTCAEPSEPQPSSDFSLELPVSGAAITPFSGDMLVKNETLGDWRTHNGIDIRAEAGEAVRAASDGTVTAVADGKAIVTVRTPEGRSAGCAVYVGQAAADYEKRDRQLTKAALGGMGILGALFLLLGIAL